MARTTQNSQKETSSPKKKNVTKKAPEVKSTPMERKAAAARLKRAHGKAKSTMDKYESTWLAAQKWWKGAYAEGRAQLGNGDTESTLRPPEEDPSVAGTPWYNVFADPEAKDALLKKCAGTPEAVAHYLVHKCLIQPNKTSTCNTTVAALKHYYKDL